MSFVSGFQAEPVPSETPCLGFAFKGAKLVIQRAEEGLRIPFLPEVLAFSAEPPWRHYFGVWNGTECYAVCRRTMPSLRFEAET
jgi:hypothetical protein